MFVSSKSIPQGASTTIYACVAPRISTEGMRGAYLHDCGPSAANANTEDNELNRQFYDVSNEQIDEALKKLGIN
jgi:hypothetical protein